jgi:hypothetical protein
VAQNQKIEYLFAAQVTGQNELKKLTDAVDSLRKEMDALRNANGPLAAGMGAVEGAARKSGKGLDAASKAIRNHRQGVQQAGMQLNDFATSVSTGASPIQAFNQQIGQLGYAMSMMGGVAGKIGNFLAGPWSILVIGAAMVIGFLIEKFTAASAAASELQVASSSLSSAQSALGDMFDTSTGKIKSNTTETRINTLAKIANLKVTAAEAAARAKAQFTKIIDPGVMERAKTIGGDALNAIYDPKAGFLPAIFNKGYLANLQSGRKDVQATFAVADALFKELKSGSKTAGKELENLFQKGDPKLQQYIVDMNTAASYLDAAKEAQGSFDSGSLAAGLLKPDNKRERKPKVVSETDKLRAEQQLIVDQFEKGTITLAEFETQLEKVTDKYKEAQNPAQKYLDQFREADKAALDFTKSTEELSNKSIPDYIVEIRKINKEHKFLQDNNRASAETQDAFNKRITAASTGGIDALIKKYDSLSLGMTDFESDQLAASKIMEKLKGEPGADVGAATKAYADLTKAMENAKIREKNEEIKNSFEAIGNSVSEAFKGMLTGAMSWKDGMRSIIGSVIDQLWKLFVVQQIVGLITGAFGGAKAAPNAASGAGNMAMRSPGNFMPLTLRARGGSVANNTPYMVGEQGPELFVPSGNGTIIPNHNMRGGGGGSSFNISVDARGSNDPAAVRAQVQQGILEAAPAIIAAAESRTIAGLRRPRLGGAMQ